ncbi:hypothetical protein Droror1_Dr00011580 [Drosera rotundifolia]
MATPGGSCCKCGLQVALVLLCLFSLTFLTSNSVSLKVDIHKNNSTGMKTTINSKLVLGSRPPRCINRCMNCRPCMAVLVIPPHKPKPNRDHQSYGEIFKGSTPQDDEGYYLLSWKCRCKNKLYQP